MPNLFDVEMQACVLFLTPTLGGREAAAPEGGLMPTAVVFFPLVSIGRGLSPRAVVYFPQAVRVKSMEEHHISAHP